MAHFFRFLGVLALLVAGLVAGVAIHMATPTAQRLVREEVNGVLRGMFRGQLEIVHAGHVGMGTVRGLKAVVHDPDGHEVAVVDGLDVHVSLLPLVWALVRGRGDLPITIESARVRDLEVTLLPGPDGEPTLLHAFDPAKPSPPPTEPSRGVAIRVGSLRVDRAHFHARPGSFEDADATFEGLRASLFHDSQKTTGEIALGLAASGAPAPYPLRGQLKARASLSTGHNDAQATLDGEFGDAPLHLQASLLGEQLKAALEVRPGSGSLELHADGTLGATKTARAEVVTVDLDPSLLWPTAPQTQVRARIDARLTQDEHGAIQGEATAHTEPLRVTGQDVPAVDLQARFTAEHASGTLDAREPGAPVHVAFVATYAHGEPAVTFDAQVHATDLSRVPALRSARARGAAEVHVEGDLNVARKSVDGQIDAKLSRVAASGVTVERLDLTGHVAGALPAPGVMLDLRAENVGVAGRTLSVVAAGARGPALSPSVGLSVEGPDLPSLNGKANLAFGAAGLSARDVRVIATRKKTSVTARVAQVAVGGGRIDASGIDVSGLGAPIRGEVHARGSALSLTLGAPAVDLEKVSEILGLAKAQPGRASIDAAVRSYPGEATGHVNASVETSLRGAKHAAATVALTLRGRRGDGQVSVDVDDTHVKGSWSDVSFGGSPLSEAGWRRATGSADFDLALDLTGLARVIPPSELPFGEMGGHVALRAHVTRADRLGPPDVVLEGSTSGLALAGKPSELEAPPVDEAPPPKNRRPVPEPEPHHAPWETRDADARVQLSVDSRASDLTFDGSIFDRKGAVVTLRLHAHPPVVRLWGDRSGAVGLLERMPLDAHVEVPMREVSQLPKAVRPAGLYGRLGVRADISGAIDRPQVRVKAQAAGLSGARGISAVAFDGSVDATYDGQKAEVTALVQRPEGRVLDLRANLAAPIAELLGRSGAFAPWNAGATVTLNDFPLEGVPQLASRGVAGKASGSVTLEGLHRDARFEADVRLARPRLGAVCFDDGEVQLKTEGGRLSARAHLQRPGTVADAKVEAATLWGAEPAPALDTTKPIDMRVDADDLRAASLMPFLKGAIEKLDGRIDVHAKVHVEPQFKTGTVDGDIRVSKGVIEVPGLDEELHDLSARVSVRPWGTLRIDDVSMRGATGRLTASAQAVFDGIDFRKGTVDVAIPRDDRLPLTVQGVELGAASGDIHVDATKAPDQNVLKVEVDASKLQVMLPQATGRSVQSLGPADHVVIGMHERDGRFVALATHAPEKPRAPNALELLAEVNLGNNVRIRRDTSLDVTMGGKLKVDVKDTTVVDGQIHLVRGTVEAFGKRFQVEQPSTVSFTGDPSSPQLVVTAVYDAPDQTKIYVDIVGTIKKLNVKLRSEPARSQDEILGLLLFGSEQGMAGTPPPDQQPDPTQRAASLASGVVTQGINKALSGISSVEIATRVDTSEASNPRPQVQVRLSDDVLANVTVNTGLPAPGEPPDRTLLTVDWRFKPRWSLAATVGDQGSTFLDLLWHHRY